jgi:hypothetical protein
MAKNNSSVLGTFIGTVGPVTGFMAAGENTVMKTSSTAIKLHWI